CAAFTYSFLPIFSSRSHVQSHLNHFNTAIGIYYMVSLGVVACSSIICHIFLHISGGPSSEEWQVGASVDIMLRSIVIIIFGVPPPEYLIQKLRIKLFERAIINVTIRERGVVSTGIIMDEFCEWQAMEK
ncbi:365_t:CDS:1, partial [Dentiscutata heterogama]